MANLLTNADFTETLPNGRIVGWAGNELSAAAGVLTSTATGEAGSTAFITAPVTWLYADYTGPAPYPLPEDWEHHAADRLIPEPEKEYAFNCQMGVDGGDVRAALYLGTFNMKPGLYGGAASLQPSTGAVKLHEITYSTPPPGLVTEVALQATVPTDYVYTADGADSNGLTVIFFGQAGVTRVAITGAVLDVVGAEPPPEPEPEISSLARRVAAFLGKPNNPLTLGRASVHCEIVTEYVRGYTRGRGFDAVSDAPANPLESVIVAATARLTANPEQVSYYATGDYSERPAVLAGWTLPELAVLNRYRKRTA